MSEFDDLVEAVLSHLPVPLVAVRGTIVTLNTGGTTTNGFVTVSYLGSDPVSATWSGAFDTTMTSLNQALVGAAVMLLIASGQPYIVHTIVHQ